MNKLGPVLKYLDMSKGNDRFRSFNDLCEGFVPKLARMRNGIAHGSSDPHDANTSQIIYNVLTIELSICLHEDLASNSWETLFQD